MGHRYTQMKEQAESGSPHRLSILHLCPSVFICGSVLFFLFCGCASAVSQGQSTALSGVDLVQMTDDMAMKVAADPEVQAAIAKQGSLRVVVLPAENRMRAEVLPAGEAEAFTVRLRTLLAKHEPGKFTWIINRDTFYKMRARELEGIDLGPAPDAGSRRVSISPRGVTTRIDSTRSSTCV